MNCRKVCGLLSAYIDSELAAPQMQEVGAHLNACPSCRLEEEALSCTKKLVASLATRAPQNDLERLLSIEAHRAEHLTSADRLRAVWEEAGYALRTPILSKPLTITTALSLAGLWLATTTLDGPRDWDANRAMLNAALPETPQMTVIVFRQAAPLPAAYGGMPVSTVAWPVSLPNDTGQYNFSRVGMPHPSRGVFVRAAYPAPVPFDWSNSRSQNDARGVLWQPISPQSQDTSTSASAFPLR